MNSASDSIFKTAQEAFRDTLSTKDQARYAACDTPTELVKSLQNLETLTRQGQKRKLNRCLKVVEQLNTRLQVYFDALNVIAGTNDAAALVYGAVRVVLQLAAALPTFFDRLLSAISRLADTFPQYEAIVDLFDGNPSIRMRQHLEKVYQDFFEFLRLAAKVFTASSGRVKRPVEMIVNVIWKPFDATFSDILARMDYHRVYILEELEILQARRSKDADRAASLERAYAEKERVRAEENRRRTQKLEGLTKEMKQAQEREIKESSVRRLEDWLAAPLFAESLEASQEHRMENTAQWIFQKEEFRKWASMDVDVKVTAKWRKMPPWVLWAHGNPGCGKTVMASSVYDELVEEKKLQPPGPMVCYFFFKHTDPRSSTIEAAYRSALAQILHRHREDSEILEKFLFVQSDSESLSGQSRATAKQLDDLMCIIAHTLGHIEFVIDGIDEANDPINVIERLKVLVTTAPVKLICFSRSNVNRLQYLVPTQQRIIFSRDLTTPDIRIFLEEEISAMIEENVLPISSNIQSLVESLLRGADGMFLWAKLMIRYLRSPALSGRTRLSVIQSVRLPEGLDAIYNRIVSLIMGSGESELKLAKEILLWIQHSKTVPGEMSFDWLRAAVGHDWDPNEKDAFVAAATAVCNGLVEFSDRSGFSYTHLTVSEYFEQKYGDASGKEVLVPDKATAMPELASRCIDHLLAIAPSRLPLDHWSRDIYESVETLLGFHKSFEAHVTGKWVSYLASTPRKQVWRLARSDGEAYAEAPHVTRLKATIAQFLRSPLAVGLWIENLYALKADTENIAESIIEFTWSNAAQLQSTDKMLAKQLAAIAKDLQLVEREWGLTLREKPHIIWSDVVIFSKLETLSKLDTSRLGTVSSLLPAETKANYCSTPPLCSISSTSNTGQITGVLTIIPSAEFVRFWRSDNHSEAYTQGESFCGGWVANYEIWSQDSKTRMATFQIPLPQKEIMILLRQSFREESNICISELEGTDALFYEVTFDAESYKATFNTGNYKTSFPLAIGNDCLTFSVLRTIYRVLPDQSKPMGAYQSSLLPLECIDCYQTKWGEELSTFSPKCPSSIPDALYMNWRDWYTYSVSISPGGTMASFADYIKPCQVTLAVFLLDLTPTLTLRCIKLTRARLGQPRVTQMHFHPWRPLLTFLAEDKVWLWNFGEDKTTSPVHLKTDFDRITDYHRYYNNGYYDTAVNKPSSKTLTKLSFSACGKFILARNATDTVVLPIPDETIPSKDLEQDQRVAKRKRSEENTSTNLSLGSLVHLASDQRLPERTLSGAHLSITGTGSSTISLISGGNNVSLELSSQGPLHKKVRRQLVALPDSIDTMNKEITVRFPETPDAHLRVILDKTATESYTLAEDRHFSHPTVIEKNVRLVEPVKTIADPAAAPALDLDQHVLVGDGLQAGVLAVPLDQADDAQRDIGHEPTPGARGGYHLQPLVQLDRGAGGDGTGPSLDRHGLSGLYYSSDLKWDANGWGGGGGGGW
ncbi:hypothetical protein PG984_000271 [Apiospora sp. TS-2023a]